MELNAGVVLGGVLLIGVAIGWVLGWFSVYWAEEWMKSKKQNRFIQDETLPDEVIENAKAIYNEKLAYNPLIDSDTGIPIDVSKLTEADLFELLNKAKDVEDLSVIDPTDASYPSHVPHVRGMVLEDEDSVMDGHVWRPPEGFVVEDGHMYDDYPQGW